ncbi:hypothetical protein FHR90_003417 [Endobacter medicaginis]|uniref:Uncharacterized protein n=1 Tax=Endobacter medicaginis TaxID=1181271 RepID=A0A839V836_9PROT|nr:hypothetical protein [Endobacter medicaginis]MBB3175561.1 hypothetical protein [Endobacter medicaginis]MCX5476933.1 hypothetical protein [Endobacter medicaginis]NVN29430.1 hypothetical protein [Endobacter medicaginis]
MDKFDWHHFKEGRIRFSGATRGIDQTGYDTFEVDLPSGRYLGQLQRQYPDPDRDAFNLAVRAFGAVDAADVGGLAAAATLRPSELDRVRALVHHLADEVGRLPEANRPFIMQGLFLGKVVFPDGWAHGA